VANVDAASVRANGPTVRKLTGSELMQRSGITQREEEICALVTKGLTNIEIGKELGISRYTVMNHLNKVYRKIGVPTRTRLSFFIQRHYFVRGNRLVRKPATRKQFNRLSRNDVRRSQE
jgi:DNA-binding CsgD family transcriptional regulator